MKLVPLKDLFHIEYGNQYDLNKMDESKEDGINFISRSSKNLGVVAKIKKTDIEPYSSNLITVTLGGTYLLSSFVQPETFYTAQNIKVLKPKIQMTLNEKIYYCICIGKNRFRYSSHGREANKTLDTLLVPDFGELPNWIKNGEIDKFVNKDKIINKKLNLSDRKWSWFEYQQLFDIERGKGGRKNEIVDGGKTPFITSIDSNNGLTGYINKKPTHNGNVITVNRNGSIGEAFYQKYPFCSTEDVHVFNPKFKMNPSIGVFLITLIRKEIFRYSYGRKWGLDRMNKSKIKLPKDNYGNPDWKFMEKYVNSIPFSKNLI